MPSLRREQLAGMGLHYLFRSFDYFLKTQSELGFKTIEMWAGAPHFLVDDTWHQDCAGGPQKGGKLRAEGGHIHTESAHLISI